MERHESVSKNGIRFTEYDARELGAKDCTRVTLRVSVTPRWTIINYGIPLSLALTHFDRYNNWFVIIEPFDEKFLPHYFKV